MSAVRGPGSGRSAPATPVAAPTLLLQAAGSSGSNSNSSSGRTTVTSTNGNGNGPIGATRGRHAREGSLGVRGAAVVELARDLNGFGFAFTTLPRRDGIVVRELRPGGAAERDGRLQRGHVVRAVNGQVLHNVTQADVELLLARAGNRIALSVVGQQPGSGSSIADSQAVAANHAALILQRQRPMSTGAHNVTFVEEPRGPLSRGRYAALTALKVVLAFMASLFLFSASIVEGFARVTVHTATKAVSSHSVPALVVKNVAFDWMQALWYVWVLDDPTQGFVQEPKSFRHRNTSEISLLNQTASTATAAATPQRSNLSRHNSPAM